MIPILFLIKIYLRFVFNMKIVFFQPNFRVAGVEKVNITLANEMFKMGVDVEFLVFSTDGQFFDQLDKNIRIINLGVSRALFSFPKLIPFFLRNRVNLVSSYNNLSILAIAANLVTLNGSRIYACEHNTLSVINKANGTWRDKLVARFLHWFYPLAAGVIAVSEGVAEDLCIYANVDKKLVKVLHNPVVNEELIEKSKHDVRHEWLVNKSSPVFIGCGRLEAQKNFTLLIDAFSKVAVNHDAKLLILGEGRLQDRLQAQIDELGLQDKCNLVGYVDNPYKYMAHSDVFVLSSDFEGLPTVLIEALACDLRVISTDCPSGAAEILEDGKWGRLVPVNDVDALAIAMLEALNNPLDFDLTVRANDFTAKKAALSYLDYFDSKS